VALNVVPTALNITEMPSFLHRAADLGADAVDVCPVDGDHPQHDFMRHPGLLADIDPRALARAILQAIDELPALEVGGFEPVVQCLECGADGAQE
jgi:hypothetical protein